jgi:hypothetical protein
MKPLSKIVVLVVGCACLSVVDGCGGVALQATDAGANAGRGGSGNTGNAGMGGAGGDAGSMGGHVGGAGQDGGAPVCSGLDQSQCSAAPGCTALTCPTCSGQTVFSSCYRAVGAPPPSCIQMGCPAPESCNDLSETACQGRSDCQTEHCPNCDGGVGFAGCIALGEPAVQCPAACLGAPCGQLNEGLCKSRSDCTAEYCPNCSGGQTFEGCAGPGEGFACAAGCPAPPPCSGLDETSCKARSDCHPGYCGNCGGAQISAGCVGPNDAVTCPLYACPIVPTACANVADEATCDARADCHSVFVDHGVCDCAVAGCCTAFGFCGDGGKAACNGPTGTGAELCMAQPPGCEGPAFVLSYTASCYEGCVRPTECGL